MALVVLSVPTLIFGWNSVQWNLLTLPDFAERGKETSAKVIAVKNDSSERIYSRTVVVRHKPSGSTEPFRNWLRSGYVNRLTANQNDIGLHSAALAPEHQGTRPLKVGDLIDVIYLRDSPHGRAVLRQDFLGKYQAPVQRSHNSIALFATWFLLFAAFVLSRPSSRGNQL